MKDLLVSDTKNKIAEKLIGYDVNLVRYFKNPNANNDFTILLGGSGTGKTTALDGLKIQAAEMGRQVISIEIADSGNFAGMQQELVTKLVALTDTIDVRQHALTMPLIFGDKDEAAATLARLISRIFGLAETYEDAVEVALQKAIREGKLAIEGLSIVVDYLKKMKTNEARAALRKITPLMGNINIKDGPFEFDKPIFQIDFSGYSIADQIILEEFVLWSILQCAERGDFREKGLMLACDEFQNISTQKGSAMYYLLQIARKEGVGMLLATPEFPLKQSSASYLALEQCSTALFFQPGLMDTAKVAALIADDINHWSLELATLERGEFVAVRGLVDEEGNKILDPITLRTPKVVSGYKANDEKSDETAQNDEESDAVDELIN